MKWPFNLDINGYYLSDSIKPSSNTLLITIQGFKTTSRYVSSLKLKHIEYENFISKIIHGIRNGHIYDIL